MLKKIHRLRRKNQHLHTVEVASELGLLVEKARKYSRKNRRIVHPPAVEEFNSYHVKAITNCLGFVLGAHSDVQPGSLLDRNTCSAEERKLRAVAPLAARLQREGGFTPATSGSFSSPPPGTLLVAALEEVDGTDFHVLVYGGRSWYHKPGNTDAGNKDSSGRTIKDPVAARYYRKYRLVGYYWVDLNRSTSRALLSASGELKFVVDNDTF